MHSGCFTKRSFGAVFAFVATFLASFAVDGGDADGRITGWSRRGLSQGTGSSAPLRW